MAAVVFFGGSRVQSAQGIALCRLLAVRLARAGCSAITGCAQGADQAFAQAFAPRLGSTGDTLAILAAGGRACASWWVRALLPRTGLSITWWAGGSGHIVQRLAARTAAGVQLASQQPRACAVLVLSSTHSPGSLQAARAAAAAGLPLFVFLSGALTTAPVPVPLLPLGGSWRSASFCRLPCLRWVPPVLVDPDLAARPSVADLRAERTGEALPA